MSYTYVQRVQILTPDGVPVKMFGAYGTEPGQFHNFIDAAADGDGNIYVLDDTNVTVYDSAGEYSHRWAVSNGKSITFLSPYVVVLTKTSSLSGAVRSYQTAGTAYKVFSTTSRPFKHIRAGSGGVWLQYDTGIEKRSLTGTLQGAIRPTSDDFKRIFGTPYCIVNSIAVWSTDQVWWHVNDANTHTIYYLLNQPAFGTVDYSVGSYFQVGRPLVADIYNFYITETLVSDETYFWYSRGTSYDERIVRFNANNFALDVPTFIGEPSGSLGAATLMCSEGYNPGQLAYRATGSDWSKLKALPVCISGGNLVVLDGTYVPAAGHLAVIDDPYFGNRHYLTLTRDDVEHRRCSRPGDPLTSKVSIGGTGQGMSGEILQDGSLRVAVVDSSIVTRYRSYDDGRTWEVES